MTFGTYLRRERERLGMSQRQLAVAIGKSAQFVNDVEHDRRYGGLLETLERFADALRLPRDVVFYYAGIISPDLHGHDDPRHVKNIMAAFREDMTV